MNSKHFVLNSFFIFAIMLIALTYLPKKVYAQSATCSSAAAQGVFARVTGTMSTYIEGVTISASRSDGSHTSFLCNGTTVYSDNSCPTEADGGCLITPLDCGARVGSNRFTFTGSKTGYTCTSSQKDVANSTNNEIAYVDCTPLERPIRATCQVNNSDAAVIINTGGSVTWSTSNPTGGNGTYSYSWSGTDNLSGTDQSVNKTYSTAGSQTASVTITSGSQTLALTKPGDCPTVTVTPIPVTSCYVDGAPGVIQVDSGSFVNFSWSATNNPTSCTGSDALPSERTWPGTGSWTTPILTNTTTSPLTRTYSIKCSNAGGTSGLCSASVIIQPVGCSNNYCAACNSCAKCIPYNSCGWDQVAGSCKSGNINGPSASTTTDWRWSNCDPPPANPWIGPSCSSSKVFSGCKISGQADCTDWGSGSNWTLCSQACSSAGTVNPSYCNPPVATGTPAAAYTAACSDNNIVITGTTCSNCSNVGYDETSSSNAWTKSTITNGESNPVPAGHTIRVTLYGNVIGRLTCGTANTPSTSSSYKCLICGPDGAGARGYWTNDCSYAAATGQRCGSTTACTDVSTKANVTDQRWSQGTCYLQGYNSGGSNSGADPRNIVGQFWVQRNDGTRVEADSSSFPDLYPVDFWVLHSNLYGGHCYVNNASGTCTTNGQATGGWAISIPGDSPKGTVNSDCAGRCDTNAPWPTCGVHMSGDRGQPHQSTPRREGDIGAHYDDVDCLISDDLQLFNWSAVYEPIGYYTYQTIGTVNSRTQCVSGQAAYTCSETCTRTGNDRAWNCSSCGTVTCENGKCTQCETETVNDGSACQTASPTFHSLLNPATDTTTLSRAYLNNISDFCFPDQGNPRIDLVFRKLSYTLSGTVCNDYNGNGFKDLDEPGFPNLTVTLTPQSGSVQTTTTSAEGTYSFTNLPINRYTVAVQTTTAMAKRKVTPNPTQTFDLPPSKTNVNFCISSFSPWIQVVGDMHSQTSIDLMPPPGRQ